MRVASLLSGAKGEEAHKEYREGDERHRGHSKYCLCIVFYDLLHTLVV